MIQSGAKVTIEDTDAGTVISILPEPKTWHIVALSVWCVLWGFSGILAMIGSLKTLDRDGFTFLIVFFGFWVYFLFYAVRSLLWQQVGAEFIRLTEDSLDYKRSWQSYGNARSYDLETIKELGVANYDDKKFAKSYNDAFWTVGGEMIGFDYIGRKVALGFKLTEEQAKNIVRRIEKAQRHSAKE